MVLPCKTLNHQPTNKITRQTAYAFPDDIVYFSQDISVAYHTVPLGSLRSPAAFSTTTFGFLGVNLPTLVPVDPDSDADTYEVVD